MTTDSTTLEELYARPDTYCQTCDGVDLVSIQSGLSCLGSEYYTLLMGGARSQTSNARLDAIEAEIDELMDVMPQEWRHHCLIHYWGFILLTGMRCHHA